MKKAFQRDRSISTPGIQNVCSLRTFDGITICVHLKQVLSLIVSFLFRIDIVGIGTHPSRGLRKGVVVDIDATVDSIKRAVEEAELMADCEITSVYAGIAGGHIRAFNSHGVVAVKERDVREGDVKRVIAEGDLVMLHVHSTRDDGTPGRAIVDIFRLENGMIVEHWDNVDTLPPTHELANAGKF